MHVKAPASPIPIMKKLNPGTMVTSLLRDKLAKFPLPDRVINPAPLSNPPKANLFVENEQFRTLFDLSPDVILQAYSTALSEW